jgi:hypothetical protein
VDRARVRPGHGGAIYIEWFRSIEIVSDFFALRLAIAQFWDSMINNG